jgi:nucleotide-binding universal stress UspA family protein
MIERILVATDGSDHATKAVTFAADLAVKYGAHMILLHAVSDWGSGRVPEELLEYDTVEHVHITDRDLRLGAANDILRQAETVARGEGVTDLDTMLVDGRADKAILQAAKDRNPDLIVMGSRGLGDAHSLLMGSVSHKVSHLADCTCITVK